MIKRFHISKNLIPEIFQGGVSSGNGEFSDNPNRVRTSYIDVIPGETYSVNSGNQYLATGCFYSNQRFTEAITEITGGQTTATFQIPEGSNQVALGFRKLDATSPIIPSEISNYILCQGSSTSPYEPYGNTWVEISLKVYDSSGDTWTESTAKEYSGGAWV